jgi:hypothetical protein
VGSPSTEFPSVAALKSAPGRGTRSCAVPSTEFPSVAALKPALTSTDVSSRLPLIMAFPSSPP